jgi:hypothetical protein
VTSVPKIQIRRRMVRRLPRGELDLRTPTGRLLPW